MALPLVLEPRQRTSPGCCLCLADSLGSVPHKTHRGIKSVTVLSILQLIYWRHANTGRLRERHAKNIMQGRSGILNTSLPKFDSGTFFFLSYKETMQSQLIYVNILYAFKTCWTGSVHAAFFCRRYRPYSASPSAIGAIYETFFCYYSHSIQISYEIQRCYEQGNK